MGGIRPRSAMNCWNSDVMPGQKVNFIIEDGAGRGREIVIKADGSRIGRSSSNDIIIKDPALSRYHCRVFFKPGEGLWAEDLGGANQSLLNKKPLLTESRILPGDRLTLGDTTLLVLSDECLDEKAPERADPGATEHPPASTPPPVSARLSNIPDAQEKAAKTQPDRPPPAARSRRPRFSVILAVVALCLGAVVLAAVLLPKPEARREQAPPPPPPSMVLTYEKIQASPENIFRYAMDLKENRISAEVDDIENSVHIPGNQQKPVSEDAFLELRGAIERTDFFNLPSPAEGQSPNVWEVMDLSITDGTRHHRVRVVNAIEPEQFEEIRKAVENLAAGALGVSADAISKEDRLDLAHKAVLRARDLYDQREVKHENLFLAIRALRETEAYLEPISEKPPDYGETMALLSECEAMLKEQVDDLKFQADHAARIKDWSKAIEHLSVIMEIIPDSNDERNQYASRKRIEFERRIKK